MELDDDIYKASQASALAEFERQKTVQTGKRLKNDWESEAYARALAESEYEEQRYYDGEQTTTDDDLEQAIQLSEQEARVQAHSKELEAYVLHQKQEANDERNVGAWHCPHCTFTNSPYRPVCKVCRVKAPSHVLTFAPLSSSRFGVEIEIIVPEGDQDGYTLESIAEHLSCEKCTVKYMGYSHETEDCWKIVTDSSLRGNQQGDLCFELVSPILQGELGLESMRQVLGNLRRLGIATNTSCGFHVHIDAEHATVRDLVGVARCYVALENAFDLLMSRTHRKGRGNRYCASNRLHLGNRSNRQRWEWISACRSYQQLVDRVCADRYMKLNLTNVIKRNRPSTIEFRQHGGIVELLEAEAWVRLVLAFGDKAPDAICLLPEAATPRDELFRLFQLLNIDGLEQYYATHNKLFRKESCVNDWTCRTCHKIFPSSRALSQHLTSTNH